jgi:TonB family protein
MLLSSRHFSSASLCFFLFALAHAQATKESSRQQPGQAAAYSDSADGLQLLLQDALAAARQGDDQKLVELIKGMEIPNFAQWFKDSYGKGKGDSWAKPYGSSLDQNNAEMRALLMQLSRQNADIITRKVNDAPQSDMERGELRALKRHVDIFFAGSRTQEGTQSAKIEPLGYFIFVDGAFRWDSNIRFVTVYKVTEPPPSDDSADVSGSSDTAESVHARPGKEGVGYPSCLYCPAPSYSADARKAKYEGTVLLLVVVEPNGRAADIRVTRGLHGLEMEAVEAVQKWRFKPALGPDGKPVAVVVPLEVAFRLAN